MATIHSLTQLPTELHLLIARELAYPDALSLKHTCRHFYRLINTGVRLKVAWLEDRRRLGLPMLTGGAGTGAGGCTLKTDQAFCASREVRTMMERWRWHADCVSSMSTKQFSNTDTGAKPADPYKEKNIDHASVKEKVEDLAAFVKGCKYGMMTTRQGKTGLLVSRCMALAGTEDGIDLLFHTNTESGKTDELNSDPHVNMAFLNGSGEWASIGGNALILTDRATIRKTYAPSLKAWVGDLGDDPRIGVIRINAVTATYAIADRNFAARAYEIAKGTLTGEAPNVQKLRELSQQDLADYKRLVVATH
ncbi:MAG: hypothetical protein M1826_007571 [Phylliscum demangeonii]|nr:MAG: hypothetical protein M1826_007571 [Phylliscum demangeonii]